MEMEMETPEALEIAKLRLYVRKLEENLKTARGTGDHTEKAAEVVKEVARGSTGMPVIYRVPIGDSLGNRIKNALTRESLTLQQLSKAMGESVGKLSDSMRTLRSEGKVCNVGNPDNPIWTWRIGDSTETKVLQDTVKRLISERPMTTKELVEATGARMSRVGGVIIAIQRSGDQIFNLGNRHVARWFLAENAKPANLPPKAQKSE